MAKYLTLSLVLLSLLSCDRILSSTEKTDNSLTSVKITDNLQIELSIKLGEIESLEDIDAQYKLKNISDKEIVYKFPNSCQYAYTVSNNQNTIFDSRQHVLCLAVLTALRLEPGQMKSLPISPSKSQNKKLDKGTYELEVFLRKGHNAKISAPFKVE